MMRNFGRVNMTDKIIVPQEKLTKEERAERFNQVRHLQTLRWAYLSTYIAALGWFLSIYFKKDSTLTNNNGATFVISLALAILGVFLGLRVFHYTRIIGHDLKKIGTTIPHWGWMEYAFIFLLTTIVFTFGILNLLGIR